jgi:phosphomannomutase
MIDPAIFKANDIRGVAGDSAGANGGEQSFEWDADGAYAIGAAAASVLARDAGSLVLGRDMRISSPQLAAAFADGACDQGVTVIDAGLTSTDQLWFCSGRLDLPGAMITASHNPSQYNGIKFCLADARPVSQRDLKAIKDAALAGDRGSTQNAPGPASAPDRDARAELQRRDMLGDYAAHLHNLVNLDGINRLRVVVDAGNGMAGHTMPAVLGDQNVELIGLYTQPDGTFPNHPPNPLEPANRTAAAAAVTAHRADLALIFDGDADRCFILDEAGELVSPSAITAMIAVSELGREPGGTIVINQITSRSVGEIVATYGGRCVVTRVGHTFVKAAMAAENAIFGGEHSAHYYFREFWGADSGMLAALHVLAMRGRSDRPLSQLAAEFIRYASSGEINSYVDDADATITTVADRYADRGRVSYKDGLTVSASDWWFNLRPSNTEPLLRLNVESVSQSMTDQVRDEVLAIVRG